MPTEILGNGLPYTVREPPCECATCRQSFRSMSQQIPPTGWSYSWGGCDDDDRTLAAGAVKSVREDLAYLRTQWSAYGKTIMNRWKKKSRDKRATLLKEADPTLFEKQWVAALFTSRQLDGTGQMDARKYRNALLLDYLNVDGLKSDPARLMGLIHNRTLYGPEEWALHDNEKLEWSWNGGLLDIDASNLCMIMHGARYGDLVVWEAKAAHRLETIGYSRGKLVLEAQMTLYSFLRKAVELLSEGMRAESARDDKLQPSQLEFKRSGRIDLWSTYISQPFSAPPSFNLEELHSKALTRFRQADDHLWLLQTDPEYLRGEIRIAAEGFPVGHPSEDVHKWAITNIYHDIWSYWSWSWIVEAFEYVKTMQMRFRDDIHPGQPLPSKYEQVLQELELLLEFQIRHRVGMLPQLLAWRPGFKDYFEFDHSDPDQVTITGVVDVPNLMHQDPLFYILHILPEDHEYKRPGSDDMISRWAFLEDHLSTTTPKDAARLDQTLYNRYADYAALHELFSHVHLHRPMPKLLTDLESFNPEEIEKLGRPTILRHQIERILQEEYWLPRDHDSSKMLLRFSKTFDDRATSEQTKLEHFDATRAAMSNFWSLMRRKRQTMLKQKKKNMWPANEIEADLEVISADTGAEYKDLVAAERQNILDRIEKLSRPTPAQGTIQTEWGSPPETKTKSSKSKKVKSRPDEQLLDISSLSVAPDPAPAPQLLVPVKPASLRILIMMFSSTVEAAAKLINWDDFVLAMHDAGFSSRQTTGSEVVFQPEEGN
ncbi:hypothetical protein LSUE1_G008594, partial [Lachnellula suecica]